MFLFKFAFALLIFGLIYHFCTKKYLNPYKLYLIFGKKGSGKSTLLTKLAVQARKAGKTVYTTEYIPDTYQISIDDIGIYDFEKGSVLLVDEVGMKWDNRKYKEFKDFHRDFFKLQRHYNLTVYLFSQTFDVDKKIRDLTDNMYLCKRFMRVFSIARKIDRTVVLNNSTAEAPSSIDENLTFVPIFLPGAVKVTYIPKYTKYFDSFNVPQLKYKMFEHVPALECQKPIKQRFKNWVELPDEELSDIENEVQHSFTASELELLHSPSLPYQQNSQN